MNLSTLSFQPSTGRRLSTAAEKQIVAEMIAVQGKPADIGGYSQPDDAKASAALRPSKTLNEILATI